MSQPVKLLQKGMWSLSLGLAIAPVLLPMTALAQAVDSAAPPPPTLRLLVNSNQDAIAPDDALTLREALSLLDGSLSLDALTPAEQAQVSTSEGSRVEFDLPPEQTTIQLAAALPTLVTPGLVIDGTTQPGYDPTGSATAEIAIPIPLVSLTPVPDADVFRGFAITASDVTIRGLSLYGFTSRHGATASTPPADIFISHSNLPPVRTQAVSERALEGDRQLPPQNVVIEQNWLGLPPSQEPLEGDRSAFGVVVFNAIAPIIRQNRIENHDGSAIITGIRAEGMQVQSNILVGNGVAGMPDAIRLEGQVNNAAITGNLICASDGSGVYLFKPEGAVQIRENQFRYNSRRFRRAAIYLMGSDHQVLNNDIGYQPGPGVVVAAYPSSHRNTIEGNQFTALEGLSIDLNTQDNVAVQDFQVGDGPNPPRNSPHRRNDTANGAINAPELTVGDRTDTQVTLMGQTDPGSVVSLYRVTETDKSYGALGEFVQTVQPDDSGEFVVQVAITPGNGLSAIATDPRYGTSEPSPTLSFGPAAVPPIGVIPRCTTPPVALEPEPEPEPEPQPIPEILQVPTNVHFALDQSTLSPESQAVLDRIAEVLRQYPSITVELQGHTDPRASAEYNIALSNRRALSVRNYLLQQGIAPERMTIRAFGEELRRTDGSSRLDYARDRRVELVFSDSRGFELQIQEMDLQLEP
ncbi:OmpA family protein [Leptolyngbya sp. AN02str]|uniref:OmpA family protein n=1 Tax=Leptolyngbya sp. AN02str TaxID=3423363 RepID=UPI003D31637A